MKCLYGSCVVMYATYIYIRFLETVCRAINVGIREKNARCKINFKMDLSSKFSFFCKFVFVFWHLILVFDLTKQRLYIKKYIYYNKNIL